MSETETAATCYHGHSFIRLHFMISAETAVSLQRRIVHEGYAFVRGDAMRALLAREGGSSDAFADWDAFVASWDDLRLDTYMAEGARSML